MGSKRELEDWLTSFLELTKDSEAPESFRLWSGISMIAAALERKCFVSWGALTFYPNMYIILVGSPATRKGTAMRSAERLLRKVPGVDIAPDAITLQALIRRIKESVDTIFTDDGMRFHCSMTIYSEEFSVFLGYDNKDLMASLCDWYDCKDTWTYDTKHQGRDEITGLWVNMIGATTPYLIRNTLPHDSIGGGLTSRIIFVYSDETKLSIYPYEDPALSRQLQNDLEKINLMKGQFRLDDTFVERWTDWRTEQHANPPTLGPEFEHYIGRRPTHIMKLSMIMAAARDNPDMIITAKDLDRAITILEVTEEKMPLTFRGYGRSNIAELLERVLALTAEQAQIPVADIMQEMYRDADKFTLTRVLETIETMGRIRIIKGKSGPVVVSLHPKFDHSEEAGDGPEKSR